MGIQLFHLFWLTHQQNLFLDKNKFVCFLDQTVIEICKVIGSTAFEQAESTHSQEEGKCLCHMLIS